MEETFKVIAVNGILEAGKTHFLNEALAENLFIDPEACGMILQCEEGLEEYDENVLRDNNTVVENFEDKEDFLARAEKVVRDRNPDVVYIEENAMWDDFTLPDCFEVVQTLTIIDATTFRTYFNNMRQKFVDLLTPSNVVIMFNCVDEKETTTFKRNMKLINRDLEFLYFDPSGNQFSLADDLPYSLEGDKIVIDDESYGIWFIDCMDYPDRYNQKNVVFTAQIENHPRLPKNFFLAGRKCMTCCANDIQEFYTICDNNLAKAKVKRGDWVSIYGTILYRQGANGEAMPYVRIGFVQPVPPPDNEVIGLS